MKNIKKFESFSDPVVDKKYKLSGNKFKRPDGKVLYEIVALRDIYHDGKIFVFKDEFGGYIEKEENLSQDGECWVAYGAIAYDNCQISGDVFISMNCQIFGDAKVSGSGFFSSDMIGGDSVITSEDDFVSLGFSIKNRKVGYSSMITYVFKDRMLYSGFFIGPLDVFKRVVNDLYKDPLALMNKLNQEIDKYNDRVNIS